MAIDNKEIIFNIDNTSNIFNLTAKQGDTTGARSFIFRLIQNNKALDLEGITVRVGGTKADGTEIFNDCRIIDAKLGFVEMDLTTQMCAINGALKLELLLFRENTRLSSIPFTINIIPAVTRLNKVQSSDEFGSLQNALWKTDNTYNKEEIDNKVWDMKNMGTDIKKAMAGGAVAVVGVDAVGEENIKDYSINTKKYKDNSVTKEKLDKNITLYPTPFNIQKIIQDTDYFKTNMPVTDGGIIKRNIPSIFANTDYSISFTATDTKNYVWLTGEQEIKLNDIEKENVGNKLAFTFLYNYKGIKALDLQVMLHYIDDTREHVKFSNMIIPRENKTLTIDFTKEKYIKKSYFYIELENGTTIDFTNSFLYYGSAIDDTYNKIIIDKQIKDTKIEINKINKNTEKIQKDFTDELNNSFSYINWYKYTNGIADGTVNSIPLNQNIFKLCGNVDINEFTNNLGTNRWIGYTKKDDSKTPYIQIKIDKDMLNSIDKSITQGQYNNDAYVDFEFIIDSTENFNIDIQLLGREKTWIYFPKTIVKHDKKGKVKYNIKLNILSEFLQSVKLSDLEFLAIYLVIQNDKPCDLYVGAIKNIYGKSLANKVKIRTDSIENGSITEDKLANNVLSVIGRNTTEYKQFDKRVAFVGDSVTWGNGGLNDGYLGVIDNILRTRLLNTKTIDDIDVKGTNKIIYSAKFFNGKAIELSGVNSTIDFDMKSDKLNICYAANRKNVGTSIIELIVDGKLLDTFSTFNTRPSGTKTLTFNADGKTRKFKLGMAFTYNHKVTVSGQEVKGKLNTGGYGANFPSNYDYLIIRSLDNDKVIHTLYFKNPPSSGTIKITFDFGESITYARETIGEIGVNLNSGLESYYGDDKVSFDPSNPSQISSGLDFRKVDKDSILRYNFGSMQNRHIQLRIKSLDTRANKTDIPIFVFNFATDSDYEYMNAGIGGYQYTLFNTNKGLLSYKKFMEYEPDIMTVLLGTNDDWGVAEYLVYQNRTVQSSYLEENSYYWIGSPTKLQNDRYAIQDRWVDIKAFDMYSVTLANDVMIGNISKNDILIVNKWGNDEKYCQVRLIDTIDGKKVTFKTPIDTTKINLDTKVHIKSIKELGNKIDIFINNIKSYDYINPKIYLACMGVPNMNHRQLLGYREYLRYMASKYNVEFIDLYKPTSDYESTVEQDLTYEITSNGATEYVISSDISPILRNVSVIVDDIDIFDGQKVKLCGGHGYYYNNDLTHGYKVTPTKLQLKTPIEAGKKIIIKGTTTDWSADYTHMSRDSGKYLYGKTILDNILI